MARGLHRSTSAGVPAARPPQWAQGGEERDQDVPSGQPSLLQHNPKGSCVYSASHPEPRRHLLPSKGRHPGATAWLLSSCPPAVPDSLPLGPPRHTAAGASPTRRGYFWLQRGLSPGLPTAGERFVQHPQRGGARTFVVPPEVAPAPPSRGSGMLPEPGVPPDLRPPSAHRYSSDAVS